MKRNVKKLPKSQVSIEVSIPEDVFAGYKNHALKHLGEHVEIQGFRKGKAPLDLLEKEIKQAVLLEEMANHAIGEHLPKIFIEEKIDAIGRPIIQVSKVAHGNPLEFTATVAVMPEIKLPDYKKIAAKENAKKEEVSVTDEEVEKGIIELKKMRLKQKGEEPTEDIDPSLTDEDVKSFGPFESVEDFKKKFKENMLHEKEARAQEKVRIQTLETILKDTEVEIPDMLVQGELENLLARMKADISNMGLSFDDYLKHIKKTEEDMRTDLLPDAEKRAKSELIMYKIGEVEKLIPEKEEIEQETKRLLEIYKDADPHRARAHVTQVLSNEKVFKFLEEQK